MPHEIEEELAKFPSKQQSHYPTHRNENVTFTSDCFVFYYLDIIQWHVDRPGLLYLFGKTYDHGNQSSTSCSVTVKYCYQRLYFLPRQYFRDEPNRKVSWQDVFDEVCESIIPQLETQEVEFRKVRKKFAFDEYTPEEAEYFEIKCNVGNWTWNWNIRGTSGNTYSKILGISRSAFIETILLERRIRGPCWLQVANYVKRNQNTYCCVNIECCSIDNITPVVIDIKPPIKLMGLEFKTVTNENTKTQEIISVSFVIEVHCECDKKDEVMYLEHYCIISTGKCRFEQEKIQDVINYSYTNVLTTTDEEDLLHTLIGKMSDFDPDFVYGHNMLTHHLDLLYSRLERYRLHLNFQRLSKLKFQKLPSPNYKADIFCGRVLSDTKLLAEEMTRSKTYSLHELAKDYLAVPHQPLTAEMWQASFTDHRRFLDLIAITVWDVICVHKLMRKFNALQLIFEITNLCGNTLNQTCAGSAMIRCQYLMLHAFHERNYIAPSRYVRKDAMGNPTTISGGLVLEPEVGLHEDFVLAMDFKALYPSIIREFNVCFTTKKVVDDDVVEVDGEGVLPQLITELIDKRNAILREIATIDKESSNDYLLYLRAKQNVVKIITNAIFGYLGCKTSRFLAEHLANFITAKGREILSETVKLLSEYESIRPIYGDTDSVMVVTKLKTYHEVLELSNQLTRAISSRYKHVVIENAGIYKPFYILRKKKYAAMRYVTDSRIVEEIKGLDVIRKDWSGISSSVGTNVVRLILAGDQDLDRKIYKYLEDVQQDLEANYQKYDIESFAICKKLNKDPEKYSKTCHEHVNIALKYNQAHTDQMKEGDIVAYVICVDGSSRKPMERVYHVEEFLKSDTLRIDLDYYRSHQIYPVVKRICAPLFNRLTGKELLEVLNVRKPSAEGEKVKKKRKVEMVEPIFDPSKHFYVKCEDCGEVKWVSYASLDFVKSCNKDCNNYVIEDFAERLTSFCYDLCSSYKEGERTFKEAYEILVDIRCSLVERKSRVTAKDSHTYLSIVDSARKMLLKDVDCWNLKMSELFKVPPGITF